MCSGFFMLRTMSQVDCEIGSEVAYLEGRGAWSEPDETRSAIKIDNGVTMLDIEVLTLLKAS